MKVKYPDTNVIVFGDMNARTAEQPDFVELDSSNHLPLPDDYIEDLPSTVYRTNQDRVANPQGNLLLELCKSCNLRIVNGRMHADKNKGKFTLHSWNGASAIDMVLASPSIFDEISNFEVMDTLIY